MRVLGFFAIHLLVSPLYVLSMHENQQVVTTAKSLTKQKQVLCDELIGISQKAIEENKKAAWIFGPMGAGLISVGGLTLRSTLNKPTQFFGKAAWTSMGFFTIYSGVIAMHCFVPALAAQYRHKEKIKHLKNDI